MKRNGARAKRKVVKVGRVLRLLKRWEVEQEVELQGEIHKPLFLLKVCHKIIPITKLIPMFWTCIVVEITYMCGITYND